MSDVQSPGATIRAFRKSSALSLDDLADKVAAIVGKRPSTAKLSRIETDKQPVPSKLLKPFETITGIPAKNLRPDLAECFEAAE